MRRVDDQRRPAVAAAARHGRSRSETEDDGLVPAARITKMVTRCCGLS